MREQVGRSIGLSARKVQVRFKTLDPLAPLTDLYHLDRIILTCTLHFRSGSRRVFLWVMLVFVNTYLMPIHRISVRRLGGRVIAIIRVLPLRLRAHRSTAPFLMCPPLPFYTPRHLPRLIPPVYLPMNCMPQLIPHRRLLFTSMRTEGSSSSSPPARAAVYLVLASLEEHHLHPRLPLLHFSRTRLNDNNNHRCRRLHRSLTLVLKRDHHQRGTSILLTRLLALAK
jgi:hypothetical protein